MILKTIIIILFPLILSKISLAQDTLPKLIIKKQTLATNEPSPNSKKVVYLLVNDTLPILATYDGYYYIQQRDQFGFVYCLYGTFYGDSTRLAHLEVNKASLFINSDKLNITELRKIEKGKFVLLYKTGKPGLPASSAYIPRSASTTISNYSRPGNSSNVSSNSSNAPSNFSSTCGARTKSGRPCQRMVKGGGRCWQHGG